MKALPVISLLLAIIAWGLMIVMGVNMLSGEELPDRSCGTACVQSFFFSSTAVAFIGVIVAAVSMKTAGINFFNVSGLLASLAICGVVGFLFVAGNFF